MIDARRAVDRLLPAHTATCSPAGVVYPLLADPLAKGWTALQSWDPEARPRRAARLPAGRREADTATVAAAQRRGNGTFELREAPTGAVVGTVSATSCAPGSPITLPANGARVLLVDANEVLVTAGCSGTREWWAAPSGAQWEASSAGWSAAAACGSVAVARRVVGGGTVVLVVDDVRGGRRGRRGGRRGRRRGSTRARRRRGSSWARLGTPATATPRPAPTTSNRARAQPCLRTTAHSRGRQALALGIIECQRRCGTTSTNARPPSSGRSWRSTSRRPSRSGPGTVARTTGGPGVLGDGAQRDGGARAGRLPRPAPHQRRPHPHRQGLPLLRRPAQPRRTSGRPSATRCATSSTAPTASSSRCCTTRASCSPASPTTRRSSSARRTRSATIRSVQLVGLGPARRAARRRAVQRRGREAHHRAAGRHGRRPRRRRPAPTWPPTSPARSSASSRPVAPTGDAATDALVAAARRPAAGHARRRARPRLRRRRVAHGAGLRRGRHRAPGARHPRAAVRRGVAAARRARPRPVRRHRRRARLRAAGRVLDRRRALRRRGRARRHHRRARPDPHELPAGPRRRRRRGQAPRHATSREG